MNKTSKSENRHIGAYIRETIIPQNMSVSEAAELLGVGRPALSNLLNGHASLSSDMATRIERAFGTSARELMDMQADYDTRLSQKKGIASSARAYTPPFMQFKANDIVQWASTIKARTRFAVLLRTLINSTGLKIKKIDFPGNDDAERPGWDGFLETEEGTPWIPVGMSGWEFGTNKNPKKKADDDYQKSLNHIPLDERLEITFVFVTPMHWEGKTAWRKERKAEKNWKEVLAFDVSDLEQWLEQSIPGQAWFACETAIPSQGVISLDECWKRWAADSEPPLSEALYDAAIANAYPITLKRLTNTEPLIIASDSIDEALAFLHCLFSLSNPELSQFRDRIAVFTQPGTFKMLAVKPIDFIAVITSREIEREFAPYKNNFRSIIIYPRSATITEPDIFLEPLNYDTFSKALEKMGYNRDQVDRLGHESGRSLTVLRRRLSKLEAVRIPEWASNIKITAALSSFLFAGAWDTNNEADKIILSLLSNGMTYLQLENEFMDILLFNDSPVWSVGHMRGLVSKIDTLYAINKRLIWDDIERFLSVAHLVLSEDDPSLDLPEEDRWAANIYGKSREISTALRDGICETLVLLAVYGNSLFQERLGHNIENKIGQLIKSLLTPLTTRKLEAQSSDLPIYAEAAPEVFLQIIEEDLKTSEPQSLGLLRPVSGIFGHNPRTGLLWALESIAWLPEYLIRIVHILAELSQIVINDNWVNKPKESLSSIFRFWMPQTTAPLNARITTLEYLVKEYPNIAWPLCVKQFDSRHGIGSYNYKPRWRTEAHGAGEPVSTKERFEFSKKSLEIALDWHPHTADTLGDLVSCIINLPEEYQNRIFDLIEIWNRTADEGERSVLREKIRTSVFTRRAKAKKGKTNNLSSRANKVYQLLEPTDVIIRNEWLFMKQWVEESYDDTENAAFDYDLHSSKIRALRRDALIAIMNERGLEGVLNIAGRGECSYLIGVLLYQIYDERHELLNICMEILVLGPLTESNIRQSVISGLLQGLVNDLKSDIIIKLINQCNSADAICLLLQAPFSKVIWDIVDTLDITTQASYWNGISPNISIGKDTSDLQCAIDRLLSVKRPRAAFIYAHYHLEAVPPKLLYKVMTAMISSSDEAPGTYQLDSYYIVEAFNILTASAEIPVDQMAGLEFQFIEAFSREETKITNLEKHIEKHPEIFVQALVMLYKRADEGEDPEELRALNQQVKEQRANAAYHLLKKLSEIPGHNKEGELDPNEIENWVQRVREYAKELSRANVCESCLGELFSKAPIGKDGIWPCEPVRKVIEHITNERFANGLMVGRFNSRVVHWHGEGGDDERKLAEQYEKWAKALEFSYPNVSAIHRLIAKSYQNDAIQEDMRDKARNRLLN